MQELKEGVIRWIEEVTGGTVAESQLIASGGRLGYRVDVERGGKALKLFLQRGREVGASSFLGLEREAEVFRALESLGLPVPHVWGASADQNVLLVDRLDGTVWFHAPRDPDEQLSVAKDFIGHLARWHSAPAAELDLPSFRPVLSVREHQRAQLAGIRKLFEASDAEEPIDALARLTLDFLEKNIPDYDGPPVLVQGDTGPGNFLYRDGKVIGIIDWELAHLGDPMDDIAWLSWRAVQHGFPDFPTRMREYEKLSGNIVDDARVCYYRVNACARLGPWFGLADMGQFAASRAAMGGGREQADSDRGADGSQMIMSMLHRRMRLEALGTALGIDLPSRQITLEADLREHAGIYDNVLRQLQVMVPLISDRKASSLAKGVARQIKYLKEIDRNGAFFEQHELDDISRLLGRSATSLVEGRPALAKAAREGKVDVDDYLLYHWNRMVRDDHLMRLASGQLFERSWPALR